MELHSQKYGYEDDRFKNTVSADFHCPICLNVLKEPKMCRNNEHIFCSSCITEHLGNSETCPECMEELTVETLHRAPRVLVNYLSQLTINCDYFSRGCREFVRLEDLQTHVMNCGFAAVKCSNNDCGMIINKRDKIHHEAEVCHFRKVKCHDCGEMKKEIEGIKDQLNQLPEMRDQQREMRDQQREIKDQLDKLNQLPEMRDQQREMRDQQREMRDQQREMKDQLVGMKAQLDELSSLKEDMKEVRAVMGEVLHKLSNAESPIQVPLHVNATKQDIVIVGGYEEFRAISSGETFSWNERAWAQLPPMKKCRARASSFVYENQIFVSGGETRNDFTDSMEILKIGEQPLKWTEFPAKLPFKSYEHKTVVYQNSLIHVGGCDETKGEDSDAISEVLLTPPYSKKLLCTMPQPRILHGVEIFMDNILIMGGSTCYSGKDSLDSVLVYDVNKKECKQMPSLPRAVWGMATVSWQDKVVVIGGLDKDDKALNDVLMYDSKTGESNVLPSMQHKRYECSAIITGNVIVVMGGQNEKCEILSSVECFTLGGTSWEELPPMIQPRHYATAVVMPSMF